MATVCGAGSFTHAYTFTRQFVGMGFTSYLATPTLFLGVDMHTAEEYMPIALTQEVILKRGDVSIPCYCSDPSNWRPDPAVGFTRLREC